MLNSCFYFQKPGGVDISPEDTLISYLPLAHSYERLLEVCKMPVNEIFVFKFGLIYKYM
jgi:long-subunit acyl-CoA synthetase (AMP-forming)